MKILLFTLLFFSMNTLAMVKTSTLIDEQGKTQSTYLKDHEPNLLGLRYDPKIFWRFEKNNRGYLDFEYAHESNGQYISSKESYDAMANDLASKNKGKHFYANDYITRGWDYYGITTKYTPESITENKLSLYLSLARYIGGILQGDKEEYFKVWEAPRKITERQQVNGFRFMPK